MEVILEMLRRMTRVSRLGWLKGSLIALLSMLIGCSAAQTTPRTDTPTCPDHIGVFTSSAVSTQFPTESGRASEAIYYVSAEGNDRTGTPSDPATPYRSPRCAYSDIPADITRGGGDHVIQLMDGTVYGQLTMTPKVTDAAHRIILRAADGVTPTMDAYSRADGSPGRAVSNPALRIQSNYVVVQGLRFNNTSQDPSVRDHEVMVRLDGSNVVIDGNYFDGNGRSPTTRDMFLLVCNTSSDNLISGNRFDFSGGKSLIHITASCGSGSPGRQVIRNNALSRFGNNPQLICAAINFGGLRGTFAGTDSVVENNTIYDNGGGCYGLLDTNTSVLTVRNNIFSKITGQRFAIGCGGIDGSSSGVAQDSVMFGNTNDVEPTCGLGGWTLSTYYADNPYFVDPGATPPDLHVESPTGSRRNRTSTWHIDTHCSVAVDKAPPSDAFDMEPSPNGGRRNLGAYGNTPEASKSCGR